MTAATHLRSRCGATIQLEVDRWFSDVDEIERELLVRLAEPVLDVGCGPGRIVAELARSGRDGARGRPRARGGRSRPGGVAGQHCSARCSPRCRANADGRRSVLLDGNIGIGGDAGPAPATRGRVAHPRRYCAHRGRPTGLGLHRTSEVRVERGDSTGPWFRVGAGRCRWHSQPARARRARPRSPSSRMATRWFVTRGTTMIRPEEMAGRFRSSFHDPRTATLLGVALGVTLTICFATGLLSHPAQHPHAWFGWPTRPAGLYRISQGLHTLCGVVTIPLLLAKLWVVSPKLLEWPPVRSFAHALERLSVLPLIAGGLFMLFSGVANLARWYPWGFFFPSAHYAVAWITFGSIVIHLGAQVDDRQILGRSGPDARGGPRRGRRSTGLPRWSHRDDGVSPCSPPPATPSARCRRSPRSPNVARRRAPRASREQVGEGRRRARRDRGPRLATLDNGERLAADRRHAGRATGDAAADRRAPHRVRRGLEHLGDLDRCSTSRSHRPLRRAAPGATVLVESVQTGGAYRAAELNADADQ